jgi:predicted O-methyltransferase YrrM
MIFKLFSFVRYLIRSFHLHGIHPPFAFRLTKEVIRDRSAYYAYDEIEAIRSKLLLTQKKIRIDDFGEGKTRTSLRRISSICRTASQRKGFAQMIHRLTREVKADQILELGTSLGITTAYLAKARPGAQIISIEGAAELHKIADINLKKLDILNVKLVNDRFEDSLEKALQELGKVDLAYFDGNHQYDATLKYFESCLEYAHEKSLFIFDDIHWSAGMQKAWDQIIKHPRVQCSIDLFQIGLIYFDRSLTKQNLSVYHSANFSRL